VAMAIWSERSDLGGVRMEQEDFFWRDGSENSFGDCFLFTCTKIDGSHQGVPLFKECRVVASRRQPNQMFGQVHQPSTFPTCLSA
jgi:hypothetical protein